MPFSPVKSPLNTVHLGRLWHVAGYVGCIQPPRSKQPSISCFWSLDCPLPSIPVSVHIYIYMYTYIYAYVYMYIHIHKELSSYLVSVSILITWALGPLDPLSYRAGEMVVAMLDGCAMFRGASLRVGGGAVGS